MAWNGRSRGISPGVFRMSKALLPGSRSLPPFFTAPYLLLSSSVPWRKKSKLLCAAAVPPVRFLLRTYEGYAIFGLKGRKRKKGEWGKTDFPFSFGVRACLTLQHVCGCFCCAEQDMRAKVVPGLPKVSPPPPLPSSPTKLPAMLILDEGARTKHLFLACIEGEVLAEISPDTLFALWRRRGGERPPSSPNLE